LEKFILTPKMHAKEEASPDEVHDFHRAGLMQTMFGPSSTFIDEQSWPYGPFQNFSGNIRMVKKSSPQYVVPHIEDHDQIQVFLGETGHPDSLIVEITLEDQKFHVKSPFVAAYPKGLKHAERIMSGSGWFLSVHLAEHCVYYRQSISSCPVKVGKFYDVEIEELSRQGQGIARVQGFVLFVSGARLGDRVKVMVERISLLSADAEIVSLIK
jgi:predicted RNA-binding protein with TRAM domain